MSVYVKENGALTKVSDMKVVQSVPTVEIDFANPAYTELVAGYSQTESTKSITPNIESGKYLVSMTWCYNTSTSPVSVISSVKHNNTALEYHFDRSTDDSGGRYAEGCSVVTVADIEDAADTLSITATFLNNVIFTLYKIELNDSESGDPII